MICSSFFRDLFGDLGILRVFLNCVWGVWDFSFRDLFGIW